MRYRFVLLGLFVILPVLTETPAAPVPEKVSKQEVYGLAYIGVGRNTPIDEEWRKEVVDLILQGLEKTIARRDIQDLPICRDHTVLGDKHYKEWERNQIRISFLGQYPILRYTFAEGTSKEQEMILSATMSQTIWEWKDRHENLWMDLHKKYKGKSDEEYKKACDDLRARIRRHRFQVIEQPLAPL